MLCEFADTNYVQVAVTLEILVNLICGSLSHATDETSILSSLRGWAKLCCAKRVLFAVSQVDDLDDFSEANQHHHLKTNQQHYLQTSLDNYFQISLVDYDEQAFVDFNR